MSENVDSAGAGDMQEGFQFGWEALPVDDAPGALDAGRTNDGSMASANVWPDVPGFKRSQLHYSLTGANVWPDVPEFRKTLLHY